MSDGYWEATIKVILDPNWEFDQAHDWAEDLAESLPLQDHVEYADLYDVQWVTN